MLKTSPRSILKSILQTHSDNETIVKEMEETCPDSKKTIRKICRLCAESKSVELLSPFFGSDYEKIIEKFSTFGLFIKEDGNLPTQICETCSKKLLNCEQTIEGFIRADEKLKISLLKFQEEENPSSSSEKAGKEEVEELNNHENFTIKKEPDDLQVTEMEEGNEENTAVVDSTIKINAVEESTIFPVGASENNSPPTNRAPNLKIPWLQLFECYNCKKRFITKEAVISHRTNVHGNEKNTNDVQFEMVRIQIKSSSTNEQSTTNEKINGNEIYHKIEPPINNSDSVSRMKTETPKKRKIRRKRDIKDRASGIYKCDICDKNMNSKHLLECHEDMHDGIENPFTCEKCDEKSRTYRLWYEHQKTHYSDRPITCKVCDKKFKTQQNMKFHVNLVHMRGKQYACSSCRKQFKYLSALTYHVKNQGCDMRFGRYLD